MTVLQLEQPPCVVEAGQVAAVQSDASLEEFSRAGDVAAALHENRELIGGEHDEGRQVV